MLLYYRPNTILIKQLKRNMHYAYESLNSLRRWFTRMHNA